MSYDAVYLHSNKEVIIKHKKQEEITLPISDVDISCNQLY